MTRRRGLVAAVAVAAIAIAGCGDDDEVAMSGPATLVPASSTVYIEAVLRPEGEQREALDTSLGAILGTEDPGSVIVEELNQQLVEDDAGVTYEGDIEPWLGERGAIFFTELFGEGDNAFGDGIEGAFVVEATDTDAAQAFADKVAAEVEDEDEAFEIVGDAIVFGSQSGVDSVVDTEAGGESLADDADFADLLGDEAGSAAGSLFIDTPAIVAEAEEQGELAGDELETIDTVFAGIADEPLTAVLDAEPAGFGLDVSYGATDTPFLAAAQESALLRELPADSWFAAGFSGAGEAIGSFVDSAEDFGVAEEELESTREEFRRELGLELEDFYEPLGDGAVFANGEGIFGTGGGLVFQTDDPDAATKVIEGLERAAKNAGEQVRSLSGDTASGFALSVSEVPGQINFVAAQDRIVIAYGEAATSAAIEPDSAEGTLGESEGFTAAEEALGGDYAVTAYLDFAPVLELLDLAAATDPSLQAALPYIESLDFLIAGSSEDGERVHQKTFLGVAEAITEPAA